MADPTAPSPGTPAGHQYHCAACEQAVVDEAAWRRRRLLTARFKPPVSVHERALGGPFWSCSSCHDDPFPGGPCPHCGMEGQP